MFASPGNAYFALKGELIGAQDWWQFPSQNGEIQLIDTSGTQLLQSIAGDLFYNNELLAKANDIQDIADWSLYPALSNVNMNGQSLTDVSSAVINNNTTTNSLLVTNGITSQANIIAPTLQIIGQPVPNLGQITTQTLTASGAVQAGSISSGGAVAGGSLATTGGLDMTNSGITRAASVGISNAGAGPYGSLTSPDGVMLTWNGATITTGAGGNASQWANYTAVNNVNMGGSNITNAQNIFSSLVESTTVSAGVTGSGKFVIMNNNSIAGSTTDGLTVSSQAGQPLALSSGSSLTETANAYTLTVDKAGTLSSAQMNLTAQNGSGGAINVTANAGTGVGPAQVGFGTVQVNALGANNGLFNLGGQIDITAYSGGVGEYGGATSRVSLSAATLALSAGAAPALPGLAGSMNIFGQGAVSVVASLIPPILPQIPETVYIYGLGIPATSGGVRMESPNGIQMLSDTYIENLYPLDGNGLTIQGRTAPNGDVTILDCAKLSMTSGGAGVITDKITSVSSNGLFYADNLFPATNTEGIYAKFLRATQASAPGVPNLVISNNPFGGSTNYVEISGANTIAFDATGTGALSGVQSINGAAWPPATGDASLWSQYPATSVIDVSGYGLIRVGDLSGVTSINGGVYPPVVSSTDWSLYPALQAVDMSGNGLTQLASITTLDGASITSAGSLAIFSDMSGDLSLAAANGGNVNIGTGNDGNINIQTTGAGHNLNLAGDTVQIAAPAQIILSTISVDVAGADLINVANITNEAAGANVLNINSTANIIVYADTNLSLVSNTDTISLQGQTGLTAYAATGNVSLVADSGEVVVQDSVLNMNTHQITNLVAGTVGTDAVNYTQLTFRDSTEFYVSSQGSNTNNGSILAPFLTIQAAITAAELISSAALVCSINVASGHYVENLTFNKGYVVLNGTLQSQTGNEVCEITGSISVAVAGASDLFNRQVTFQGFNLTFGAGQAITDTGSTPHIFSLQDCKVFFDSQFFVSTASAADMRVYLTNVEVQQTNAASVLPIIVTNVGQLEFERLDMSVSGNCSAIVVGGTSILSRFSLSALETTNTGATLLPLLSFTSTTTSTHTMGNVAFAYSSAVAKTNTNAINIASSVNTTLLMLNNVFTLTGTASSTNNCIGYNGVGSPTVAGVNNSSLSVNVVLPQTTSVQSGITQIAYTDINPPGLASYSSTADQVIAVSGTPQALTYTTTQFNQGTTLVANSRVYANAQGNYALSYSVELQHAGAGAAQLATTFLKKNGTTIANTGRQWSIASGSFQNAAMAEFVVSLNAGDYVEVFFNGDTSLSANATAAAGALPAIPSVVFNIKQFR